MSDGYIAGNRTDITEEFPHIQIYGLAGTPFLIFSFSPSCLWGAIVPRNHLVRCDNNVVTGIHVTDDGVVIDVTDLNQCQIFS
jgi:hypothetical protein